MVCVVEATEIKKIKISKRKSFFIRLRFIGLSLVIFFSALQLTKFLSLLLICPVHFLPENRTSKRLVRYKKTGKFPFTPAFQLRQTTGFQNDIVNFDTNNILFCFFYLINKTDEDDKKYDMPGFE